MVLDSIVRKLAPSDKNPGDTYEFRRDKRKTCSKE
jgi:hypothetical protein